VAAVKAGTPQPTPPLTAEQLRQWRDSCDNNAPEDTPGIDVRGLRALLNEHAAQQARIAELEAEMGHAAYVLADAKLNPPGRIAELERALGNVRMLVASRKLRFDREMAEHLLRFCAEVGIVGSVLRDNAARDNAEKEPSRG
jgi:hypothetical protein